MGAGSSFLDLPEDKREEIFQEMKDLYEQEYLPQVQSGQLVWIIVYFLVFRIDCFVLYAARRGRL